MLAAFYGIEASLHVVVDTFRSSFSSYYYLSLQRISSFTESWWFLVSYFSCFRFVLPFFLLLPAAWRSIDSFVYCIQCRLCSDLYIYFSFTFSLNLNDKWLVTKAPWKKGGEKRTTKVDAAHSARRCSAFSRKWIRIRMAFGLCRLKFNGNIWWHFFIGSTKK